MHTAIAASYPAATTAETELHQLLNEYRGQNGLPAIPLSPALTHVAQTHVQDMNAFPASGACNMHSWSANGQWSACCYTMDNAQASCMWDKPKELTDYRSDGYETAASSFGAITAQEAMNQWKNSSAHNDTLLNQGFWTRPWNAVGIGILNGYAVLWFGNQADSSTFDSGSSTDGGQCSQYNSATGQVEMPCLQLDTGVHRLNLNLLPNQPGLRLSIDMNSFQPVTGMVPGNDCAVFPYNQSQLHLNCLDLGEQYWLNFNPVNGSSGIELELTGYGLR
ncbi:CAP domain-containing protein [Candidatus Venteria ishoeyi]|uniref:CAP domain-containing protein n=1 Tax=Candidatus Venteria ishoeyi TaxID=1899563 RepID=UPI0025A51DE0|nr:CAP domain-containing protein [Candidatus Venteria ishoeyi]MDM8547156.1 CAP domain-containing protein [Candidatus Venteria ishoeyi]